MKTLFAFTLFTATASAAVPLEWTARPGETAPAQFTRHHGETLELRCRFAGFGEPPFSQGADIRLWYQTNGMPASAWWSVPAQASSNTLSAVFAPESDPGSDLVRLFFGAPSNAYASAVLRLRPSPGAAPGTLPPPEGFAEADPVFAAWLATDPFSGLAPADYETVSNRAMSAVQPAEMEAAISAIPRPDLTPATNYTDAVESILQGEIARKANRFKYAEGVTSNVLVDCQWWCAVVNKLLAQDPEDADSWFYSAARPGTPMGGVPLGGTSYRLTYQDDEGWTLSTSRAGSGETYTLQEDRSCTTLDFGYYVLTRTNEVWAAGTNRYPVVYHNEISEWAKAAAKPTYTAGEVGAATPTDVFAAALAATNYTDNVVSNYVPTTRRVNGKRLNANVSLDASDVGAAPAALTNTVNSWETYWDGDDVRVTVTNYDSAVHLPSLYIEQRNDDTKTYRTIWDERTRWASNDLQMAAINAELENKADRAWGYYDSHAGNYAPDGYTWISSSNVAIAAGLAYQRTLTTDGAVWVLCSYGMTTQTGGETNGFFRVSDDEGPVIEIVRGDKRTVGARASGIRCTRSGGSTIVRIPYNVVSEAAPVLYGTTSITSSTWTQLEATWTGQSGAWTGVVTSASSTFFVKAEYEIGGETYIRNIAPISVEGGIYCTDGVHKVRPVYNGGAITWEVVQ